MRATREDGAEVILSSDGTWALADSGSGHTSTLPPRVGAVRTDDGFRGVPWRASLSECIGREGTEPDARGDNHLLWGEVGLADLDWNVAYIFVEGELARGKYLLSQEFANSQRYVFEYVRIAELLKAKYGEPGEDEDIWTGDLYADSPGEWGMAVQSGELTRYKTWISGKSSITLILSGENYESSLVIEYASTELEGRENEIKTAQALSDL